MPSGREQYERQAEERRRVRRAQREAARRAARRRQLLYGVSGIVVVALVAGIVLIVAAGSSPKHGVTAATSAASGAASGAANAAGQVCTYTPDTTSSTGGKNPGLPPDKKASGTPTLTLALTEGTVTATLLADKAPCTVNSFEWLASKGFFTNTICHRLTTTGIYVLQCGDPTGTGSGGPGYTIPDENLSGATYPAGTIAMANTGSAHTGGSQFFLVYKATQLPPSYTPFGTITKGLDVLTGIAAKGAAGGTGDGAPKEKVTIKSFTIS